MNIKKDQKFSKKIKKSLNESLSEYNINIKSTEYEIIDVNSSCFTMCFQRDKIKDLVISFIFEIGDTLKINIGNEVDTTLISINCVNIYDKRERDGICCWLTVYIKSYFENQCENINNDHNDEKNKKEILTLLATAKDHFYKRLKFLIEENNLSINIKDENIHIRYIEDKYQIIIEHEADLIFSDIEFRDKKVIISCSSNKLFKPYEREFEIDNGPNDHVSIPLFISDTLIDVLKVSILKELIENKTMENKVNYQKVINDVIKLIYNNVDLQYIACRKFVKFIDNEKNNFVCDLVFTHEEQIIINVICYDDFIKINFNKNDRNETHDTRNLQSPELERIVADKISNILRRVVVVDTKQQEKTDKKYHLDDILNMYKKSDIVNRLNKILEKYTIFGNKNVELLFKKRGLQKTDFMNPFEDSSRMLIENVNGDLDVVEFNINIGDHTVYNLCKILLHEKNETLILKVVGGYIRESELGYTYLHSLITEEKVNNVYIELTRILQNVLILFFEKYNRIIGSISTQPPKEKIEDKSSEIELQDKPIFEYQIATDPEFKNIINDESSDNINQEVENKEQDIGRLQLVFEIPSLDVLTNEEKVKLYNKIGNKVYKLIYKEIKKKFSF